MNSYSKDLPLLKPTITKRNMKEESDGFLRIPAPKARSDTLVCAVHLKPKTLNNIIFSISFLFMTILTYFLSPMTQGRVGKPRSKSSGRGVVDAPS